MLGICPDIDKVYSSVAVFTAATLSDNGRMSLASGQEMCVDKSERKYLETLLEQSQRR